MVRTWNKARGAWIGGLLAIFLGSCSLYVPAIWGQPVLDDKQILSGVGIGGGSIYGALKFPFLFSYFRPGTSLSFLMDRALVGENPIGYHVTAILLHALAACAVAWLGQVLFENVAAALAAGAVFAVQPAQVSTTAWIGGRTDALSVLLVTLSIAVLVKGSRAKRPSQLLLGGVLLTCSLFVKEQNAAMLLVVPFALSYGAGTRLKDGVRASLPFYLVGVLYYLTWNSMQLGLHQVERPPLIDAAFNIWASAANYLAVLIGIPTAPQLTITLENYRSTAGTLLGCAALGVFCLVGVRLFKDGGPARLVGAGLIASYAAISNLVPIPSFLVGPYRAAVAGVFVALAVGWLAKLGLESRKSWLLCCPAALFTVGCIQTVRLLPAWRSEAAYVSAVVQHDPAAMTYSRILIGHLIDEKRFRDADLEADRMLSITYGRRDWNDPQVLVEDGKPGGTAYQFCLRNEGVRQQAGKRLSAFLLAKALVVQKISSGAAADRFLIAAAEIDPRNQDALRLLGDSVAKASPLKAIDYYTRSITAWPLDPSVFRRRGELYLQVHNLSSAETDLRQAVDMAPNSVENWLSLANLYTIEGMRSEAFQAVREAQKRYHGSPANLGRNIQEMLRRVEQAARP